MSNFRAMTKATETAIKSGIDDKFRRWQPADWLDNYFGPHQYGIRFDNDPIVRADNGDFIWSPDTEVPASTPKKEQGS